MITIDAHLHVWDLASGRYAWPDASVPSIHRTVTMDDAQPLLDAAGVRGAVLVQAADHPGETPFLLQQARSHASVVGVVGWVPLDRPADAEAMLADRDDEGVLVGVRALVHTYDDGDWILRVDDGLDVLESAGLAFDYVTGDPAALVHVPGIAARHPGLRIVIDHLGKPPIGGTPNARARWRDSLASAAAQPLVSAKLSGLYAAVGDLDSWTVDQVRPFVADALDLFGAERLMFGGDWPVADLAGGYQRTWTAISSLVDELAPHERERILGGTAAEVYRIDPRRMQRAGEER